MLDLDAYLEKISVLKKIYKDKINVRIGVEQGLQPHLCERINNYDPAHRLDFIIGSTHLVDGSDPYYPSFWEHHSPKEKYLYPILKIFTKVSAAAIILTFTDI